MPTTANILLNVFDGRRQLLDQAIQWSATAIDGRGLQERKTLVFPPFHGGAQVLNVPFFDNFGDNYTILVNANGFESNAWRPVTVSDRSPVTADMMLLPKNGAPHFATATWEKLKLLRPNVARMIRASGATSDAAGAMYTAGFEGRPTPLACFLNLVTAMADIQLPSGKNPLDYYWNAGWPAGDPGSPDWTKKFDDVLKVDRFFGYVDQAILPDIRAAAQLGAFSKEANPEKVGHPGATESYKQTQFDVANVQLTFHGRDTALLRDENNNPVQCVKIEPDIDFFRDPLAHGLLEFIPNALTKGKTDAKTVFALRWMAGKREPHLPEFNPLYTIEA
ncbi:MAG: hypothetical protein ABI806_00790 [Candidatus Solibacter sp.]